MRYFDRANDYTARTKINFFSYLTGTFWFPFLLLQNMLYMLGYAIIKGITGIFAPQWSDETLELLKPDDNFTLLNSYPRITSLFVLLFSPLVAMVYALDHIGTLFKTAVMHFTYGQEQQPIQHIAINEDGTLEQVDPNDMKGYTTDTKAIHLNLMPNRTTTLNGQTVLTFTPIIPSSTPSDAPDAMIAKAFSNTTKKRAIENKIDYLNKEVFKNNLDREKCNIKFEEKDDLITVELVFPPTDIARGINQRIHPRYCYQFNQNDPEHNLYASSYKNYTHLSFKITNPNQLDIIAREFSETAMQDSRQKYILYFKNKITETTGKPFDTVLTQIANSENVSPNRYIAAAMAKLDAIIQQPCFLFGENLSSQNSVIDELASDISNDYFTALHKQHNIGGASTARAAMFTKSLVDAARGAGQPVVAPQSTSGGMANK